MTGKSRGKQKVSGLDQFLADNKLTFKDVKRMYKAVRSYQARQTNVHRHEFVGKRHRIGVLGDTHFGNRWTDKEFLHDVMAYFKSSGVEAVYHTGDLTDGPWQRHNNVLEQYAHGIDEQVTDFVNDFPDIGKPVYAITGNHDAWYMRMGAGNPGEMIAQQRPDFHYLGRDEAVVKIGGMEMMLHHPDDGSAYAYSYKPQKFIEAMFKMQEKMPEVIFQGHYHKLFQMHFGGVNYYCTGTTERQTPFMRGKNLASDMGAWMIDFEFDKQRRLVGVTSKLLPHQGDKHQRAVG